MPNLYGQTATDAKRKRWLPQGTFIATSQTTDKYLRGSWNETARVEMGFYAKGADKAQIAVQIGKLASSKQVESERTAWKAALETLAALLMRPA